MSVNLPRVEFCALPPAMMRDPRLGKSPNLYRVMMAVCGHDRMSAVRGKGAGCYASQRKLCQETRLYPADVSNAIRKLIDLGYVEATRTGKMVVYRVPARHYPEVGVSGTSNMAKVAVRDTSNGVVSDTSNSVLEGAEPKSLTYNDNRPPNIYSNIDIEDITRSVETDGKSAATCEPVGRLAADALSEPPEERVETALPACIQETVKGCNMSAPPSTPAPAINIAEQTRDTQDVERRELDTLKERCGRLLVPNGGGLADMALLLSRVTVVNTLERGARLSLRNHDERVAFWQTQLAECSQVGAA